MPPVRRFKWIMPGYFETMGNPILAGRDLEWADIYDRAPVLLVTENLAREYWGEPTAAIGKRMGSPPLDDPVDVPVSTTRRTARKSSIV